MNGLTCLGVVVAIVLALLVLAYHPTPRPVADTGLEPVEAAPVTVLPSGAEVR